MVNLRRRSLQRSMLLLAAIAGLFLGLGASGALPGEQRLYHPPRVKVSESTSSNWSGYALETDLTNPASNTVSYAGGSWTVPSVTCSRRQTTYSSTWVGIDGYADNTVEQTGTEQDCANGKPRYYAWFEMYPQPAYRLLNAPVSAGNAMTASVTYVGNGSYQLVLQNVTRGWTFTTTQQLATAQRQSAEWIEEAPSSCSLKGCSVLPLANFGTVSITGASATLSGSSGTISNWPNDPLTMVDGTATATPSSLSADGSSFTVAFSGS